MDVADSSCELLTGTGDDAAVDDNEDGDDSRTVLGVEPPGRVTESESEAAVGREQSTSFP